MKLKIGDELPSREVSSSSEEGQGYISMGREVQAAGGLLSVLVIDDDPAFCRLVARSLDDVAETSFRFGAPEPGMIEIDCFDVVLLDYDLPVRNGLELLDEFRGISTDVPVLFLTAFGDPELAELALKKGATCFLPKPVEIRELRKAVQRAGKNQGSLGMRNGFLNDSSVLDENLPEVRERAKQFSCLDSGGDELAGSVSRFGFRSVFVNLENPTAISRGDRLTQVEFRFGDQLLECGQGSVGQVSRSSSDSVEIEVFLSGFWGVALSDGDNPVKNLESCESRRFLKDSILRNWSDLSPEFRLSVNDLAESLESLQRACEKVIVEPEGAPLDRFAAENQIVSEIAKEYGEVFWKAIVRFELASAKIEKGGSLRIAKSYARRNLYPFILASPFLSRVVERPIGVPGDFGMLGQILGNPLDGYDLYGRILNSWILSCGAASAYRYRVGLLHREIVATVKKANLNDARPAKILSMASGVAYEVQRFIENPPEHHRLDITLVDFSEVTLKEARRQFSLLGELPEGMSLNLEQSSVIDLANQSRGVGIGEYPDGFEPESGYDLVYCAGLFDYLSDRLVIKVTQYLLSLLGENGKLVVSNFTTENPLRAWMTFVVDWELLYRDVEKFEELVRQAVGDEVDLQKETDEDGVEIYAIVKK